MRTSVTPGLGALCLGLALVCALAGCETSSGRNLPLDKALARDSLKKFLETWQKGGKPADLKNATPSIVVSDDEWNSGRKLDNFVILPEETDDGTNANLKAQLTIGGQQKTQRYVVGTSPVITIGRP